MLTIGHSTRTIDAFINLVLAHDVSRVGMCAPSRGRGIILSSTQIPCRDRSRQSGVGYIHMAGLGGRRHPTRDSINIGYGATESFRGFGDYMQTPDFEKNLGEFIEWAREGGVWRPDRDSNKFEIAFLGRQGGFLRKCGGHANDVELSPA